MTGPQQQQQSQQQYSGQQQYAGASEQFSATETESSLSRHNFAPALEKAVNGLISEFKRSGYNCEAMASWCSRDAVALKGCEKLFETLARFNYVRAKYLAHYLTRRGGSVKYQTIQGPKNEYENPLAMFDLALNNGKQLATSILRLTHLAQEHGDTDLENEISSHYLAPKNRMIKMVATLRTALKRAGGERHVEDISPGVVFFDARAAEVAEIIGTQIVKDIAQQEWWTSSLPAGKSSSGVGGSKFLPDLLQFGMLSL